MDTLCKSLEKNLYKSDHRHKVSEYIFIIVKVEKPFNHKIVKTYRSMLEHDRPHHQPKIPLSTLLGSMQTIVEFHRISDEFDRFLHPIEHSERFF